ncbi:MAG: phosphoenolpyruvate--protein phosphotransferase [Lachnospiraceae bacterium]|nr:phosphoenolpyruvate--protein phosphotransferase [Lachnospiraceae bacterium]
MKKFSGKGIYGAIAVGNVSIFKRKEASVKKIHIQNVEEEMERLAAAKEASVHQLHGIYEKARKELGENDAQIFHIHSMLIEDVEYNGFIRDVMESQKVNAEYAVAAASDYFQNLFGQMEDAYLQARAADIRDISRRLIRNLEENPEEQEMQAGKVILCADDLAPSETVLLDTDRILAFVTALGSPNSHTAILAGSRNIPAVVGVGEEFLKLVQDGMTVGVDGYTGDVVLEPDEETTQRLLEKQRAEEETNRLLKELRGKENVTPDGRRIDIYANIDHVGQVESALANDAGGIGLFRSEFLYLEHSDYPTEEQQFAVYKEVLERMGGKKVIIRTADIGADKQADYFHLAKEPNPALGLRGIRLCISRPEMLRVQLRALYRASVFGSLGILFPMISSVSEVEKIRCACKAVREELQAEGTAYSDEVELGIMIETPAAAVISDRLAPLVDFFSVGTNDLTQYTLACDRQNPEMEAFCDTHHEAVLRLIGWSAKNAHRHGTRIGICGELAGDLTLTERFLEMGIDELSVSPSLVLRLRDSVRKTGLGTEHGNLS